MTKSSNFTEAIFNLPFLFWRGKVIVIFSKNGDFASRTVKTVLSSHLKDVLVFAPHLADSGFLKKMEVLFKKSSLPVLVLESIPELDEKIMHLMKVMPNFGFLILNSDDETIMKTREIALSNKLGFGFKENTDISISDINIKEGTNFKVNYAGSSVPFRMEKVLENNQIYSVLSAIGVGLAFGMNLVEISQSLSNLQS